MRVETEDGLHGWGEGFGFNLVATTKDAVDRLIGPACIGHDVGDIAGLQRLLLRRFHNFGRNGPVRYGISAIDIALWDIAGRRAGKPLHALLGSAGRGAARSRVPADACLLRYGEATAVAHNVAEAIRQGYRQIKLHEVDLACIRAARDAAPPEVPLMLDINCAWESAQDAIGFPPRRPVPERHVRCAPHHSDQPGRHPHGRHTVANEVATLAKVRDKHIASPGRGGSKWLSRNTAQAAV
ncbi:enolase C-terminal domain-like protein [Humitalea sp. 24SJ18S-53]|uniref:enolase C-terminal domain-like protein n=1 Tax=Humitalea sp. 24SJ18S-53 TaxID=3422307 RepID=UPI003D679CBC